MAETDKENLTLETLRLKEMVDELTEPAIKEKLTDWEYRFVSNLFGWRGEFRPLQKQNLIRIYNKYFSEKAFGK